MHRSLSGEAATKSSSRSPMNTRSMSFHGRDGLRAVPFFSMLWGQMISRTARRPSHPELSESGLPVPLEDEDGENQNPRRKTKYEN